MSLVSELINFIFLFVLYLEIYTDSDFDAFIMFQKKTTALNTNILL